MIHYFSTKIRKISLSQALAFTTSRKWYDGIHANDSQLSVIFR